MGFPFGYPLTEASSKTKEKSKPQPLKVSAAAYRHVRLREYRVCMGVQTGLCEGDSK